MRSAKVCYQAALVSAVLIYLLTAICAIYPSWLATIEPAMALHHE